MKASDILLLAGGAAAIGLAARQQGSRAVRQRPARRPSLDQVRDDVNAGLASLRLRLLVGPGLLTRTSGPPEVYEFSGINAAAIRHDGWYPSETRSYYDRETGVEEADLGELDLGTTRHPEGALLLAIEHALKEAALTGAELEGTARQYRQGRGSKSKMASFEDAVTRGFQRALASAPKEARGLESDEDGYQTDRVGALLVHGGISSRSIVGQKKLDGYRPVVYGGEGEAHELERLHFYHNPAHALLAAEAHIAFSAIANAVHESGLAQELQQAQRYGRQAKKMGLLR
jgi:hypothetical protein